LKHEPYEFAKVLPEHLVVGMTAFESKKYAKKQLKAKWG
jgi:hypothetical protein